VLKYARFGSINQQGSGEKLLSRSESWKVWVTIFAILLFFGFVAAIWPLTASLSGGSSGGVAFEPETIVITIPPLPGLEGGEIITLNSFVAFAIIAVLVIGAVIVVGLIIALLNLLLSKQTTKVTHSEKYQEGNAALQQRDKERLGQQQENRAAATTQQHDYSRWAVVATSLAILMFAVFTGSLVAGALFPAGQIMESDQLVNITAIIVGAFFLITFLILLLRMNPRRLAAVNETDGEGIPWDTIVIILLGVLVLGLGIGLVVFLNRPI
jgi:ABC-type multidrug transport system fused ATPase/permease subunit